MRFQTAQRTLGIDIILLAVVCDALFSCYTDFVAKRNLTISLDESVARWARVWAARNDTSVSRMVGDMLSERMIREREYAVAMREYLSRAPFVHKEPGSSYPSRDTVHERDGLR